MNLARRCLMAAVLKRSGSTVGSTLSDFELQYQIPIVDVKDPIPLAKYGGRHTVTMIPGTGIGPEMCEIVRDLFRIFGVPVDFEVIDIDEDAHDNVDLQNAITSIRRNGVAIKSHIAKTSDQDDVLLRNVAVRNLLDLFAYGIRCKSYANVRARQKNVDVIVFRQNIEGEYSMLEHEAGKGVVQSLKIVTRKNVHRLGHYAFQYARRYKRKKITTVHKANIMKIADGFFLQEMRTVAKQYADIEHNDMIIDNCSMQLVSDPHQFDILVTTNLYGNILTNIACGICGGPGLYSGKNHGDHYAVFEPGTRNKGTFLKGKNVANPICMINAAVDMLYYLGLSEYAKLIDDGITKTLVEDKIYTPDLGGTNTTRDVVEKIVDNMAAAISK